LSANLSIDKKSLKKTKLDDVQYRKNLFSAMQNAEELKDGIEQREYYLASIINQLKSEKNQQKVIELQLRKNKLEYHLAYLKKVADTMKYGLDVNVFNLLQLINDKTNIGADQTITQDPRYKKKYNELKEKFVNADNKIGPEEDAELRFLAWKHVYDLKKNNYLINPLDIWSEEITLDTLIERSLSYDDFREAIRLGFITSQGGFFKPGDGMVDSSIKEKELDELLSETFFGIKDETFGYKDKVSGITVVLDMSINDLLTDKNALMHFYPSSTAYLKNPEIDISDIPIGFFDKNDPNFKDKISSTINAINRYREYRLENGINNAAPKLLLSVELKTKEKIDFRSVREVIVTNPDSKKEVKEMLRQHWAKMRDNGKIGYDAEPPKVTFKSPIIAET